MENKIPKKTVRTALGRGLSALISSGPHALAEDFEQQNSTGFTSQQAQDSTSLSVPISKISANPNQPRRDFSKAELEELANSIKSVGILQPLLVRKINRPGEYEIIAGERRWRAAQIAGLTEMPVIVQDLSEKDLLAVALIENIQRENLNPIEEASAYKRLSDEFKLTQAEIAEKVGKERVTVANLLRLLSLPEQVISMIKEGRLSVGHAKAILTVREPSAQISLAKKSVNENISVRELEAIVSRVVVLDAGKRAPQMKPSRQAMHAAYLELTERLTKALGTKVSVKSTPQGKGKLEIEYFSEQELERIVDKICQ